MRDAGGVTTKYLVVAILVALRKQLIAVRLRERGGFLLLDDFVFQRIERSQGLTQVGRLLFLQCNLHTLPAREAAHTRHKRSWPDGASE